MAKEILMPKMGMTMEFGTISQWLVKEGDKVEKGDVLLEVETDKANLEAEAFHSGTVLKIFVQEGETVPVLSVIGVIGEEGEEIDESMYKQTSPQAKAEEEQPKEEVAAVAEEVKETVAAPVVAIDPKDVKATPAAKALAKAKGIALETVAPNKKGIVTQAEVEKACKTVKATPVAARMAMENGISLSDIDSNGRIYKEDVEKYIGTNTVVDVVKQSQIQKAAANVLSKAWSEMPMVTNCVEVDMSKMQDMAALLRKEYPETCDTKLGITDLVLMILARALAENPFANVHFENGELVVTKGINVGVAVATEKGLMVPVLRNADKMSIAELSKEKFDLINKARAGKLSPNDFGGAGTSLTNVGGFRAQIFTPIINYPESCIFGMGEITKKPVVVNDEIVIRPIMWLNFTYDHRVLDGAMAAQLLNTVRDYMADPVRLFLHK